MALRLLREGSTPAKIFFLFLSIFMWFLIKLSKEGYDAVIEFPVKYVNLPEKKTFAKAPPEKIRISLSAGGFNILKFQFQSFNSVKVDVSELERTDGNRSYWLTNRDIYFIENQLGEDVEVSSISPDTVFFDFNRIMEKKVAVKLNLKKDFSHLISIYKEPKLNPDSVVVVGPEPRLKELEYIQTRLLPLKAQEESLFVRLPLVLPKDPSLDFSHTTVDVNIRFTQMTQGSFEVPVEIINLPEEYNIRVFPEKVNLSYHVAVKDYNRVNPSDFRVYADCSAIVKRPDTRYLNLAIESYPAFVNYVSIEPKRVEFILTKE